MRIHLVVGHGFLVVLYILHARDIIEMAIEVAAQVTPYRVTPLQQSSMVHLGCDCGMALRCHCRRRFCPPPRFVTGIVAVAIVVW